MMNAPATREETRTAFDADAGAHRGPLAGLALAAIGIVFGDIGTSPLYTMSTVFDPAYGLRLNPSNLLGVISLIVWSLIVVVSLKYVDRKSTRLNSSHHSSSYAVFCLKKKKK